MGPVFLERENVSGFIAFARSIGCPEMDLFCVSDLYELKNFKKVCMCILSVGRYSAQVPEFEGPYFIGGKITFNREGEKEEFQNALQNGVVLCNLANKIRPNSIRKVSVNCVGHEVD